MQSNAKQCKADKSLLRIPSCPSTRAADAMSWSQTRWDSSIDDLKHLKPTGQPQTNISASVSKWNGTGIHSLWFRKFRILGCPSSWPLVGHAQHVFPPQRWNGLNSEGDMTLSPSLSSRSKTAFQAAHVSSGTSLEKAASFHYLPLFSASISSLSTICFLWGNCAAIRLVAMWLRLHTLSL